MVDRRGLHKRTPSWAVPNDLKHAEASFSPISTNPLCIRDAQMPRSRDRAIFVPTTDIQTDYLIPCACARGMRQTYDVFPLPVGPMMAFNPLGSKPLHIKNYFIK